MFGDVEQTMRRPGDSAVGPRMDHESPPSWLKADPMKTAMVGSVRDCRSPQVANVSRGVHVMLDSPVVSCRRVAVSVLFLSFFFLRRGEDGVSYRDEVYRKRLNPWQSHLVLCKETWSPGRTESQRLFFTQPVW